jgi:hypothetical protein
MMNIDGSAIEKTGFTYKHPVVTAELLEAQIAHARELGWYP